MSDEQLSAASSTAISTDGIPTQAPAQASKHSNDGEDHDDEAPCDLHTFGGNSKITPGLTIAVDSFRLWHGPGKTLSVYFADGNDEFVLPQAALSASFDYFKNLLKPGAPWSENQDNAVKLTELSSCDFGVLVTWLQSGLLKMPQDPANAITTCLYTVSTADYIQMINLEKFVESVTKFLAKTLRANRRALAFSHLSYVHDHDVLFQAKAKSIATLLAQAAVRPFLTCHLGQDENTASAEGDTGTEWALTIRHYEELMDKNPIYAQDVMAEVRDTLRKGERAKVTDLRPMPCDPVRYRDPLFLSFAVCRPFSI